MHVPTCVSVVVAWGLSGCAAIAGLDSYSALSEGVDAGAHVGGGPGEDSASEDGASNDGAAEDDGSADAGCATACTGGPVCQDGPCTSSSEAGADARPGDANDAAPEAGRDAGCTHVDMPPSINVDSAQWSFAASPTWNCTSSATTTITANTSGASIGGDNCGGSATIQDISNGYAQTTGGPSALVIRLRGLTVTGSHRIQLAGDEPVIFLVDGDVTVDSGGTIDASANATTAGPGGDSIACATSTGTDSSATASGGGGGGFGTPGGYGATSSGSSGSPGGAVAGSLTLQPLRGGCAGGTGGGGTDNPAGAGGGAFEISASGIISVGATNTAYLSAGGGYSPGASTSVTSNGSGGAGSGGGVLLASPATATFAHASAVRVHGGGSGSSRGLSADSNPGANGSATSDAPAAGGAAPDIGGAAGATGGLCSGTGTTCATSAAGSNGNHTSVVSPDGSGGGGGGGSVQVISAPATPSCT